MRNTFARRGTLWAYIYWYPHKPIRPRARDTVVNGVRCTCTLYVCLCAIQLPQVYVRPQCVYCICVQVHVLLHYIARIISFSALPFSECSRYSTLYKYSHKYINPFAALCPHECRYASKLLIKSGMNISTFLRMLNEFLFLSFSAIQTQRQNTYAYLG